MIIFRKHHRVLVQGITGKQGSFWAEKMMGEGTRIVAGRVLVRLASFKARDFPDLYRKTSRLPWGRFFRPDAGLQTRVTCHHSRLNHSERIAAALGEAADRALGREAGPRGGVEQLVLARFEEDICQLSIDSSGELLHRRG